MVIYTPGYIYNHGTLRYQNIVLSGNEIPGTSIKYLPKDEKIHLSSSAINFIDEILENILPWLYVRYMDI